MVGLPRQLLAAARSRQESVRPAVLNTGMTASILPLWTPDAREVARLATSHLAMRPTRASDEARALP